MGIVVILDQQMSSSSPDRVSDAIGHLDERLGRRLRRRFVRTAGDEIEAVVRAPSAIPSLLEFCLRDGGWWLGIGLGQIDSLGRTARDSHGPAFAAAREAVERAKRRRGQKVAVAGNPIDLADRLQGLCDAIAFMVARRTARQWTIMDHLRLAGSGTAAAAILDVTPQAVNQTVRAGGLREQQALEHEIEYLAAEALGEARGGA